MKFFIWYRYSPHEIVAPLAGAWIEIVVAGWLMPQAGVAPLAGAWIEIVGVITNHNKFDVAPLAGAWIEIPISIRKLTPIQSRSPRGSVD